MLAYFSKGLLQSLNFLVLILDLEGLIRKIFSVVFEL